MTNKKQLQKEIKDEGYISDNPSRNNKNRSEQQKKIKNLQKEVKFWSQTANNHLSSLQREQAENENLKEEIKELKKQKPTKTQSELEKALQETNQKIRDQEKSLIHLNTYLEKIKVLESENKQLIEKYAKLENQRENKEKNKSLDELFTCFTCQKTFSCKLIRLIDKNNKKICRDCLLKMLNRANQETGEEIVLRKKKKEEINEISQPPTFICQTCQQNYQGQPHQVHISNYQEQGIIPQQLTSICSYCLQDKVVIADLYCPRTSEGRDTWNPNEPQFDCYCPTNL